MDYSSLTIDDIKYNDLNNFDPEAWGFYFWYSYFLYVFTYPISNPSSEIKEPTKIFFSNIQYVLPCQKCKKNYKQHLKKYQLTDDVLSSRQNLLNWLVSMYNEVKIIQNKKPLSVDDCIEKFISFYNQQPINKHKNIFIILILLLLSFIFVIFFKK